MPRNVCSYLMSFGAFMLQFAVTFAGSGSKPSASMMFPTNGMRLHRTTVFLSLKRRPVARASNTAAMLASWSLPSASNPTTMMSSDMSVTPGMSLNVSSTLFLNTSWAQLRPNGSLRNLCRPYDVMNVVWQKLSSSNLMFQ